VKIHGWVVRIMAENDDDVRALEQRLIEAVRPIAPKGFQVDRMTPEAVEGMAGI
jgi:hypothetical protein